jgi:hypothetical protein
MPRTNFSIRPTTFDNLSFTPDDERHHQIVALNKIRLPGSRCWSSAATGPGRKFKKDFACRWAFFLSAFGDRRQCVRNQWLKAQTSKCVCIGRQLLDIYQHRSFVPEPSYIIVFIRLFPTISMFVQFWHSNCFYTAVPTFYGSEIMGNEWIVSAITDIS